MVCNELALEQVPACMTLLLLLYFMRQFLLKFSEYSSKIYTISP